MHDPLQALAARLAMSNQNGSRVSTSPVRMAPASNATMQPSNPRMTGNDLVALAAASHQQHLANGTTASGTGSQHQASRVVPPQTQQQHQHSACQAQPYRDAFGAAAAAAAAASYP